MTSISAFCFFVGAATLLVLPAAQANCINVTLPNVFNLGQCIGDTLLACPDTSDGLMPDLAVILQCVLQIVPQVTNPAGALYNVVGLLEAVLSRLGISADIGSLAEILCNPLGLPIFNCNSEAISPGEALCRVPLRISLPSVFNIGQCLNTTLLFCADGSPISDSLLTELLEAVGCILSAGPRDMQVGLAQSLICPLLDFVTSAVNQFLDFLPFRTLTLGIRTALQRLSLNVLSVVSCPQVGIDTPPRLAQIRR